MKPTQEAPFIVVFPRGQLTDADRAMFHDHGVLAVEADDPKAVVQLQLVAPRVLLSGAIHGDLIVRAALQSIANEPPANSSGSINAAGRAAHEFVRLLHEGIGRVEPPQQDSDGVGTGEGSKP